MVELIFPNRLSIVLNILFNASSFSKSMLWWWNSLENPSKFKGSLGNIILIGPDSPVGQKIEGKIRARSEIFRGALRPYVTTANQELHDVLDSKINLTLILQGNINGDLPDYDKLESTIIDLCSQKELKNNSILYTNE